MEKHHEHETHQGLLPFDIIVILMDVAKRWLLILLAAAVVGVSTFILSDLSYRPQYRATTTYVVTSKSTSTTVFTNLSNTNSLATVFSELLNSSLLRKSILEELGRPSFDGTISANVISETNLLTVTVTASDPRTAFLVSQAIIDHHEDLTYQVVDNIALEVLQAPVVPTMPINRETNLSDARRNMLLAAAVVAALLVLLSYSRDAVRSGWEVRKKLEGTYLGEIPHEKKYRTFAAWLRHQKTGILITNPATSFRFVETMRKLRRRLEQRLKGRKVLMITSLLENEGKSTVAVNLALSLAQKHQKVLLIDCDLRKPACHTLMDRRSLSFGVRDVLTGNVSVTDALVQDKKSGLYMLLEAKGSRGSGDLIASRSMKGLLKWARNEFDFVILDLPPMAEVSDAESMTRYADASILVVRQNAALAQPLNKAIEALEGGNAKYLGSVLNNVYSLELAAGRVYGYGYGYGYGSYGKYGHYGHYGASKADKTTE